MYNQFPYLLTRSFIYIIVAEENGRAKSTNGHEFDSSNPPREVKVNKYVESVRTRLRLIRFKALWLSTFGEIVRFLKKMDGPSRNLDKANFSPKKKGE